MHGRQAMGSVADTNPGGTFHLYLLSALFLCLAVLAAALCVSYFTDLSELANDHGGIAPSILRAVEADTHYKYLIPLLVPTTCWFAIANWVGWEYFRFA